MRGRKPKIFSRSFILILFRSNNTITWAHGLIISSISPKSTIYKHLIKTSNTSKKNVFIVKLTMLPYLKVCLLTGLLFPKLFASRNPKYIQKKFRVKTYPGKPGKYRILEELQRNSGIFYYYR